ncbi:MAG: DUF2148 domain-containing protein [Candidatus Omnitrophota bacterium]
MDQTKKIEKNILKQVAGFMITAARTAPKAKGADNIVTLILDKANAKNKLIKKMQELAVSKNKPGFKRDAENLKSAPVIVFIATKAQALGIEYCSLCNYDNCQAMLKAKSICAFNTIDLGIALGSAVNMAAKFHIDNRIMYSAGKAAIALNLFEDKSVKIALAIPLSATGKNIFFDRK